MKLKGKVKMRVDKETHNLIKLSGRKGKKYRLRPSRECKLRKNSSRYSEVKVNNLYLVLPFR